MSKYRKVRKETAEKMGKGDGGDGVLPCTTCKEPTPWATLSNLGARCQRCYEAFCRMPMAEFNARFKRDEPKRALPRREVPVLPGHIGEHLAKRPSRQQVRGYADELGIDVEEDA